MPLDSTTRTMRIKHDTRNSLDSCPYIDNFYQFAKEQYERDQRVLKRTLDRHNEYTRIRREITGEIDPPTKFNGFKIY